MQTTPTTYGYGLDPDLDKKAERLIRNEVLACQTGLVEHLLSKSDAPDALLSWDDIANLTRPVCPECYEPTVKDEEAAGHPLEEDDGTPYDYICTNCSELFDDPEHEPQDVLEWWLVSSYLASKLEERGEPIATDGDNQWWGRTCSGQAIVLDGIMQQIAGETM